VEVDDGAGGIDAGTWNNTPGAASQVGMLFVGQRNYSWMYQVLSGSTSLDPSNHTLTGRESVGQTFAASVRIGIQSFDGWPTAHGIVCVGLQNRNTWEYLDSVDIYTGTEAQATAAGVSADVYLGLDETDPLGASTVWTGTLVPASGVPHSDDSLIFSVNFLRSNEGDQARCTLDDMSLSAGPPAAKPLRILDAGFNGAAFEMQVAGFDTEKQYQLKRSTDLENFSPVGGPFTPAAETDTVSDPTPEGPKAFYRIEETN
jgi:hypothetical protein